MTNLSKDIMHRMLILIGVLSVTLTGCTTYSYLQSPLHGNTASYKAIPLSTDSVISAIYVSAAASAGGVNDKFRDGVFAFTANIHRSHNLGAFQAYYGASGMVGGYRLDSVQNAGGWLHNESLDPDLINANAGTKFIASAGGFGAINFVMPLANGEWRILGTELNWSKEFGRYKAFRDKIPDTSVNYVERRSDYFTIAISSDIIGRRDYGGFGFKLALVLNPRTMRGFNKYGQPTASSSIYLSQTLHFESRNRLTGYLQLNAGTYACMLLAGVNVRIR